MADAALINSAGTLVSAVLESAGYIYQSSILDTLTKPLRDEIGALVYLVGIIAVVIELTVLKSSKMAPWLLIGPAIFLFVINERDNIDLTKWSFGSHQRDQSQVEKGVNDVTEGATNNPRVSKVFKVYVEMVSTSVSSIVDTISGVQIENDLWMMLKGSLFGSMTTMQQDDPGLRQLIQYGLLNECYLAIQAARAVDDPLRRIIQPEVIKGEVDQAKRYSAPTRAQAKAYFKEIANEQKGVSFKDKDLILDYLARFEKLTDPDEIHKRKREIGEVTYSCDQVWRQALLGIIEKAKDFQGDLESQAKRLGMNVGALTNFLAETSGDTSKSPLLSTATSSSTQARDIVKVIAKYYLRNEVRSTDIGSRVAAFVSRNDIREIGVNGQGSNNFTEQARVGASEWAEKEKLTTAAHSLPTFQGLALYFLGISFPFFALLLLIPGKSTGFLLWFLMWLWVKSWDIALAIVAQLDTIFWSIYAAQRDRLNQSDKIPEDFAAAFASLEQMDPTFQMTGYYAMLAVMILAIPAVMAQLIMGSMNGGASIIAGGMSKYAEFYQEAAMIRTEQGLMNQLKSEMIELKETRGMAYAYGGKIREQILAGRDNGYKIGFENMSGGSGGGGGVNGGGGNSFSNANAPEQNLRQLSGLPSAMFGDNPRAGATYNFKAPMAQNISELLRAFNYGSGEVSGAKGFTSPLRVYDTNDKGVSQNIINVANAAKINFHNQVVEKGLAVRKAELTASMAHAAYESDIERKAYEVHEHIAIFRGLPIPWMEFAQEGSGAEFERYLTKFDEQMGLLGGMLDTTKAMTESGSDVARVAAATGAVGAASFFMKSLPDSMKKDLIEEYGIEGKDEEEKIRNLQLFYQRIYTEEELLRAANDISSIRMDDRPPYRNTEYDIIEEDPNRNHLYVRPKKEKKRDFSRNNSVTNAFEND